VSLHRSLEAEPERERREEMEMDARAKREEADIPTLERERREADQLRKSDPGRWPSWASLARMRRDIQRDREDDAAARGWR
jgi:hypothetical protein